MYGIHIQTPGAPGPPGAPGAQGLHGAPEWIWISCDYIDKGVDACSQKMCRRPKFG